MAFDQGAPQFGLNDGKIQTWASAGTYSGSITDIMSIQMANVNVETIAAILTGDDRQTAIAALVIGGTAQLRFGGLNLDMLAVLTGKAIVTDTTVENIQLPGGHKFPYLGAIFKALSAEAGDTWLYLPKIKLMSGFSIRMEYGAFVIPEVTCQVVDDASYGTINVITHAADLAVTVMPPANIAAIT